MWKKRLTVGVLIVILSSLAFYVYFIKYFGFESDLPQVVGLPPAGNNTPTQPYTGTPPSTLIRPTDPFNYPITLGEIGPVEPLFAGHLQYPFLCGTEESGLGQPTVDNQKKIGIPIYAKDEDGNKTNDLIGYSKDCSLPTQAYYYYNREGTEDFFPLAEANNDIAQAELEGQAVDFIVRVEVGTINRFLYVIAALKGAHESLAHPSNEHWNERLIYQFHGGVGIGRRQGHVKLTDKVLKQRYTQLRRGYAVAYSTANQTSNHYNIWLAEDTALRVKQQFTALYGKPLYTVGVGGSGGAIQQYLIAQNNPDLLDAAIAIYAYPDMITQTIHIMDCELLEYFFDVIDAENPKWQQWKNRQWLEGMNASDEIENKYGAFFAWAKLFKGKWPAMPTGTTECVNGWRGLTPLIHNPNYVHFHQRYASSIVKQVHWTYWDNMQDFYGVNEFGYGRNTWDNVGVQYGLSALKAELISPEEFLKLNASIGGWKQPHEMEQERYWFLVGNLNPVFSPWSEHNMNLSPGGQEPAPRTVGDSQAMQAAYRSGNVFTGQIQIPVIDVRHYLEPELNMHHLSASFSARQRIIQAQGRADQQLIWVAEKPYNPVAQAFEQLDPWLLNKLQAENGDIVAAKPENMVDKCFDKEGNVLAEGKGVWDGAWNDRPTGECMKKYPAFATSRMVAGDNVAGSVFKCALQPVELAIERGIYGEIDMQPHLERLIEIFPNGVCDYTQPDQGKPK
jgi:hypothetical protein